MMPTWLPGFMIIAIIVLMWIVSGGRYWRGRAAMVVLVSLLGAVLAFMPDPPVG